MALHWSDGMHLGRDSSVTYQAEPDNKHGEYRIRRTEGGCVLSYTQWRDQHGGAVPMVTSSLGVFPSVDAARKAAAAHHAARAHYEGPIDAEEERLRRLRNRAAAERAERKRGRYGRVRPYGKRDV